jgi:hypothetical protein
MIKQNLLFASNHLLEGVEVTEIINEPNFDRSRASQSKRIPDSSDTPESPSFGKWTDTRVLYKRGMALEDSLMKVAERWQGVDHC